MSPARPTPEEGVWGHAKYRGDDGKWGCLGCNYALYPNGAEGDYCANVHCVLRHTHAVDHENVRRLVDEVIKLRAESLVYRDGLRQALDWMTPTTERGIADYERLHALVDDPKANVDEGIERTQSDRARRRA